MVAPSPLLSKTMEPNREMFQPCAPVPSRESVPRVTPLPRFCAVSMAEAFATAGLNRAMTPAPLGTMAGSQLLRLFHEPMLGPIQLDSIAVVEAGLATPTKPADCQADGI